MSIDEKLQTLITKGRVEEVLIRYCDGCDRADANLLRTVFHDDCTLEYVGYFSGQVKEMLSTMSQMRKRYSATQHSLTNILIEVNGDVANSRCQSTVHHLYMTDGKQYDWVVGGRYVDRLENRNGQWGIASRVAYSDWSQIFVIEQDLPSPF